MGPKANRPAILKGWQSSSPALTRQRLRRVSAAICFTNLEKVVSPVCQLIQPCCSWTLDFGPWAFNLGGQFPGELKSAKVCERIKRLPKDYEGLREKGQHRFPPTIPRILASGSSPCQPLFRTIQGYESLRKDKKVSESLSEQGECRPLDFGVRERRRW